jgi:hypothetical protein
LFRKNGQPVFEPRSSRSSHHLIDITQTLQLTKSKRIPVERQTTFEKPENEESIKEVMHIKSYENPNTLAIVIYSPTEQRSIPRYNTATRTSSKVHTSQLDYISTSTRTIEQQNKHFHQYEFIFSYLISKDRKVRNFLDSTISNTN